MEVLISMFILTVGLLGVAALIPAGRHEIVQAAKLDNAAMVGRAAFRDMQVRGFLNASNWVTHFGSWTPVYEPFAAPDTPFTVVRFNPVTNGVGIDPQEGRYAAFVMDPMSILAPGATYDTTFPHGHPLANPLPVAPLVRIAPFNFATTVTTDQQRATFDSIFRSGFDQIVEPNPTNTDLPPVPRWFSTNLKRANDGNYSWMATVISDPAKQNPGGDATVSVAVFYKRDLSTAGAGEAISGVAYPPGATLITSGSSLTIRRLPTDLNGKVKPMRPGQWFMLAGSKPATSDPDTEVIQYNYYRWYKVIAAAPPDGVTQQITITGGDWNCSDRRTEAWILDNIVNVYEKQLPLELQ